MKYLILLASLVLSACSDLPTILKTCNTVVTDAAAVNNVVTSTATVAVTNGTITAAQGNNVAKITDDANAIIATASALCAAGGTAATTAKAQAKVQQTRLTIVKGCLNVPKPGSTLEACTAAAPAR